MPAIRTYSPVIHAPATAGTQVAPTRRYAQYAETHPVQPLKGLRETRASSVSYRASVPAGQGGRGATLSCRASSPDGEIWSFPIESNPSVTPTNVHCSLYIVHYFTFSAKEKDVETGLSYFGSRYYSSDLSIWLSVDPMSDDYPYQSNYVYCSNNPLMIVDPNGMFETRAEAQKYRKEHHTGGSIHKRSKHDNYSGNYSIVNRRTNTSYTKPQYQEESSVPTSGMGDDGVVTSAVISPKSLNSDANYTISSSEITSLPSNTNIMSSTATACLLLASDDWTGFGIADDIFIPVVIVAGAAAYGGVVLFAHVRKKQSTGKSKRDRHDRQYNQGGKHRPNNPNRRKGANERKNKGKIID